MIGWRLLRFNRNGECLGGGWNDIIRLVDLSGIKIIKMPKKTKPKKVVQVAKNKPKKEES